MKSRVVMGSAAIVGGVIVLGQMTATADLAEQAGVVVETKATEDNTPALGGSVGQDVTVYEVNGIAWYGSNGTETAFTLGTTSCNRGTVNLTWNAQPSTLHPVISQNIYRLQNGRLEQLGQSWLKNGFCALQLFASGCGSCPGGGGCPPYLQPGCTDPYTPTRNGEQGNLRSKFSVNANTGVYSSGWNTGDGTGGSFNRRIRIKNSDMTGGLYFGECMYTHPGDSTDGNQNNNASYRRINISSGGGSTVGSTVRERSGPEIWQDNESGVTVEYVTDEDTEPLAGGNGGLFKVGYKVFDNGDGTWDYEYAIYNMNSHESMRILSVPHGPNSTVTSIGFNDVDYLSGDGSGGTNIDDTDWATSNTGSAVTWTTGTGVNANALRWGTMYNYRFTADTAPVAGVATMTGYRSGDVMNVNVLVPSAGVEPCPEDLDGSGQVDFGDIVRILSAWDDAGGPEDLDGSGFVDFNDLVLVLSAWDSC